MNGEKNTGGKIEEMLNEKKTGSTSEECEAIMASKIDSR